MQYSSSLAGLTPELVEHLLQHMSQERLLRPRTLEFFFGCPLQKFVLNCYPYSTNELLRQLRAFATLKHLSLVNSPLITGTAETQRRSSNTLLLFEWIGFLIVDFSSAQTRGCRCSPAWSNCSTSTWPSVAN